MLSNVYACANRISNNSYKQSRSKKTWTVKDIRHLLEDDSNINLIDASLRFETTPLISASSNGYTDLVVLLLQRNANPNIVDKRYQTALIAACTNGHPDIVKILIDNKANLNITIRSTGRNALMLACRNGHIENVLILLKNYANINAIDNVSEY